MTLSPYRLRPSDQVSVHGSGRPQFLHDQEDVPDRAQLDKLIASGDCFITLASALAENTQLMAVKPEKAGPELERIILTLMYLQDNYQIYRKLTPHP